MVYFPGEKRWKIPVKLEKSGKFGQNRRTRKIREIRKIRGNLERLGEFGKYANFPENQDHMIKSQIVELLGVVRTISLFVVRGLWRWRTISQNHSLSRRLRLLTIVLVVVANYNRSSFRPLHKIQRFQIWYRIGPITQSPSRDLRYGE